LAKTFKGVLQTLDVVSKMVSSLPSGSGSSPSQSTPGATDPSNARQKPGLQPGLPIMGLFQQAPEGKLGIHLKL